MKSSCKDSVIKIFYYLFTVTAIFAEKYPQNRNRPLLNKVYTLSQFGLTSVFGVSGIAFFG